jgi:pyruvate formate lyase activating enzyme
MPHALATGIKLAEEDIAVCWETAGTMHPRLLKRAVKLSLESGGCIKFDLKAFDENLHQVLTGCSNVRTLENFQLAASHIPSRTTPPLVVASTLLLPGYVDTDEVSKIARFIANINPEIPYSLLGFHPNYMIHDLQRTSVSHANEALESAKEAGLTNVRIGNRHLLSREYLVK